MSNNSKNHRKSLKDLNMIDNFMWAEATEDPENAKIISEIIIRRVLGIEVHNVIIEAEKQYHGLVPNGRGIRLDLQVTEKEGQRIVRVYDIEPNTYAETELAKRSRYYQSISDAKNLGSRKGFHLLPEYFSIWILLNDPFGDDRMVYTVKNMVVENPDLVYNDGVTKVFLYTGGTKGGSVELRALLNFMEQSTMDNATDSDLCKIQEILNNIKSSEEVGERYMTWEEMVEYEKRDSYNAGRDDGMKAGMEAGMKSGMETGREQGFISACREFGKSNDEIVALLMEKFSLSEADATEKVTNN
jgi:predicted transposase/invertase (TIGR01784 family)